MKKILLVAFIFLFQGKVFSQISIDDSLALLLDGKEKYNEIKSTINGYFDNKLFTTNDTIELKKNLRQKKIWNRQLWISEYYVANDGLVHDRASIDSKAMTEIKRMPKNTNRNQSGVWAQDGPISCALGLGRIDEIAFHPFDANIIFAGSPHGGLFKSIDGGNSWFPLGNYLPSLGVSGIAIHPTNPDIIYVLTGDGDSNGGCFTGGFCIPLGQLASDGKGVYKSTDGGVNWQRTATISPNQFVGHELIIDPQNPEVLWAATSAGLHWTTNGGFSWTTIFGGNYWDVKIKPNDSNTIYAAQNNSVSVLKITNGII